MLYFRFFKVATLCLDDSFTHSWHSLNQLHLECKYTYSTYVSFKTVGQTFLMKLVERKPRVCKAVRLLAAFPSLCGPTPPKPSQLGWGGVIVEARSSDAALHCPGKSYTGTLKVNLKWILVNCQCAREFPTNSMHHSAHVNQVLCLGSPSSCLIYDYTQTSYNCMI